MRIITLDILRQTVLVIHGAFAAVLSIQPGSLSYNLISLAFKRKDAGPLIVN